jgi:SAM-dependent methyltransferase
MRLSFYYPPARFFYARKYFNYSINILDIGCANDSPQVTKRWFPSSTYHGTDIVKTLNPCIDSFYLMTANEYSDYDDIQNGFYDFVILNHVIEHLEDPSALIKIACSKLRPGGLLWIAFPSASSLNFPSGVGTLNFSDDSSHIYVVNIIDLSNQIISRYLYART